MENEELTKVEKQVNAAKLAKVSLPGVIATLKLVADALKSLGAIVRWLFPKYNTVVDRIENAIEALQRILNEL